MPYALPDPKTMQAGMERERQRLANRYVRSERHTMDVDYDRYLFDLQRERRAGERRARSEASLAQQRKLAGAIAPLVQEAVERRY